MQEEIIVDESGAGQRIDAFLAARLGVSRTRAQGWVRIGLARLNGQRIKPSHVLIAGDVIEVQPEPEIPSSSAPVFTNLPPLPPILFEDEHLLVLNKPRG